MDQLWPTHCTCAIFLAQHLCSAHLSYTTNLGGLLEDPGRPWTYGSPQCQQPYRERTSPTYEPTLTLTSY